jgi:hypothetical protein
VRYADAAFFLRLSGELPLAFGLGVGNNRSASSTGTGGAGDPATAVPAATAPAGTFRIPADFITAKAKFAISKIELSADIVLVAAHSRCELFFDQSPEFSVTVEAALGDRTPISGPKIGEIVRGAIRAGLESMVFPKCVVLTLNSEKPFVRWAKGTSENRQPNL